MYKEKLIGISLAVVIMTAPFYWVIDREQPANVMSNEVVNEIVYPGEYIVQKLVVDRKRFCEVYIEKRLIDSENNKIDLQSTQIKRRISLGKDVYSRVTLVPKIIVNKKIIPVEGPATLFIYVERTCNPLQMIWPLKEEYKKYIIIKHRLTAT